MNDSNTLVKMTENVDKQYEVSKFQLGLNSLKSKGISKTFWDVFFFIFGMFLVYFIHLTRKGRKFKFQEIELSYFHHSHNCTWRNERTIEVPIVKYLLEKVIHERKLISPSILEIGNVTSHYFEPDELVDREILDKYEKGLKVLNEDIVDFDPVSKYDIVFSISTLEHVGWDEPMRNPEKLSTALSRIKSNILKPNGVLVYTVPIGYNSYLDVLMEKEINQNSSKKYYFKRISRNNIWENSTYEGVKGSKFDEPYRFSNAIVVVIDDLSVN